MNKLFLTLFAIAGLLAAAWTAWAMDGYPADSKAVEEVLAGTRTDANAAWWGFDPEDATDALQSALDSGAKTVVVPFMGCDWIVRPITLRSDQTVTFEPGVVVTAKKGEFKGRGDSLFRLDRGHDVTLQGYGATLRMNKKDYTTKAYEKAEWRMALDFSSCSRIRVYGLRLESSGGDGIYLGQSSADQPYCEDIVIRDVACVDHHRQGISVISVRNLVIENCLLAGTDGTAPEAGIDFEPNGADELLENCVVKNCIMENNAGAGILVYLKPLTRQSAPVSLRFENCHIRSGKDVGIGVGAVRDDGPLGSIEFIACTVENTRGGGLFLYDKSADSARVRFVNCSWHAVGLRGEKRQGRAVPLLMTLMKPENTQKFGGVDFVDCRIFDTIDRPCLLVESEANGIHDLQGTLWVSNPEGVSASFGDKQTDLQLKALPLSLGE